MANDPLALPAACFSIIVKTDAIVRAFPGGREMFEQRFRPIRINGALQALVCLSEQDVGELLFRLQQQGLKPGQDIAVADMMHGPLLECPDVTFDNVGDAFPPQWTVNAGADVVAPP